MLQASLAVRQTSNVKKDPLRAPRFEVHLPLRYRPVGAPDWEEGRIENISRSGVLFWAEHLLAVDTPLEMSFVLPLGGMEPGVVCRGRIVRTVPPGARGADPGLAATIAAYEFVRGRVGTA